ncbi:glycoside hydrolase family 2 TIM barrel-domain containing protein [Aquimarina sediminis]|uniref:glycoside hydrolase family 2 TIM barrel-domain containing protein n=1 Tax=Aquimarina sediminis TaxID=2070536 RepID=UPI000CA04F8F|nr:glycoside hydrolase family 2 TIM barrel-domain containing protein [Aquimarina sediminis]
MNVKTLSLLGLMMILPLLVVSQSREIITLTDDWKFQKGKNDDAFQKQFDDLQWETVTVPHDWAIYGPFDREIDLQKVTITQDGMSKPAELTGRSGALPYTGEAWYRNTFLASDFDDTKKAIVLFDGAMSEPKVYINGSKVGEWNYGYNYFYFDISKYIVSGSENTIAVHLSNVGLSSRWYPGAGLYRNVRIIIKNKNSIDQWGTFITTPYISDKIAKVNIKTKVSGQDIELITKIIDATGQEINSLKTTQLFDNEFEQNLVVETPKLWSPDSPYLYTAISEVYKDNELQDRISTKFGIREIKYQPKKGFVLNGKVTKFKGVCLHHDLGPLGVAVNKAALKRQLRILKDMGANAIRSSHNMPSIEQLELCDEMGFLFLAESFDEWAVPKVENGYNRFFKTDVEKDIVNLVHATRNHPCIVMWSAGNEVPDQFGAIGAKRAKMIQDIFHREDPTRPVTAGMDQVKATMESGFGAVLDIPGLNYRVGLYDEAYDKFPQGMILGSETASTVSSRGIYKFPVKKGAHVLYDDYQCSSYDLEYCRWSNTPDDDAVLQDDRDWVIGEFVWTGFDYLGEPTPYYTEWPSRSSYFGIVDLAGLPKDRYYHYRSRWNTKDETLHILPHWNWKGKEGDTIPVFVYTNYSAAELFLNGKSLGVQRKNDSTSLSRYRLMWMDVIYEPGELKVAALDDNGNVVAEKSIHTSGDPYQLKLEADKTILRANGKDLSYVTVSVLDKNGIECPTAINQLKFNVTGKGSFRAACNGDATSLEMFHYPTMKLFSGKLVVTVQSSKEDGEIKFLVEGSGLKDAEIVLQSKK